MAVFHKTWFLKTKHASDNPFYHVNHLSAADPLDSREPTVR
jgi:hypothetical protein